MELILKPTSRCNFNCSFCSAGCLSLLHLTAVSEKFKELLNILKPSTIIVTGGEPLLVEPAYYEELLLLGNWRLSFTSNLKDFYLNSTKWLKLLKDPRVSVITSFQYGNDRMWDKNTVYDEKMFKDVFNKFHELIGYKLNFISVISENNEKYAFKHLELAKELGTKCKINGLMSLGKSKEFYPQYKLLKLWLDICESEYRQYLAMDICFSGGCNLNTNMLCDSTIRAVAFDTSGNMLYSHCEDDLTNGIYAKEDILMPTPKREHIKHTDTVTNNCMCCELFYVCNGCHLYRKLNKLVPEHCTEMKKLKERFLNSQINIQPL